ncbi:MAG: glycerol-3-phosphate dehydrogenase/oxidase, partial [Acidimicrobiales bacterium]|nr:glycerol-3-phosphate dehydrogenase/oxidase [Acidimicrobiales bacterium]
MPGAFDRAQSLRRLETETFDVVVIGAGITGAGVALDAASRGLRTALVERDDFASGTSSKSSKLVHGGLRYLQQGEVRLVYEALAERQRLRHNAPHLVHLLPFLIPVFSKDGVIPKPLARALGSAMWTYDLTGGARIGKLHKRISADEAHAHMPTLPRDRLAASYLYYDAEADDARLTLTVARTAAMHFGAAVANGCGVVGIDKDERGQANAVRVRADGREITVRTGAVVNAAGVWSDDVRALDEGTHPHSIRPAKGIHLTVPWRLVRNDIAVVVPVPKDKRSMFVVRWGDLAYIGTTDTDYDGPMDDPEVTPDDVAYVLDALRFSCTSNIGPDDVTGSWAGLRPLVRDASSDRTADLSRRHKVSRSASGVISITGGKLTTYRRMAADAVDVVLRSLGRGTRSSRTERLVLVGTPDAAAGAAVTDPLAARHGALADKVRALAAVDHELARPLVLTLPYLAAEAVYAVRHEMAMDLSDVLDRRTRCRIYARDDTADAAADVAAVIGPELGWSPQRQRE